jgi:DNA-binding XRE family transcriptional regulator
MTKLEQVRVKQNYSQREIANAVGIAVSTYCQYENGVRSIPIHIANAIAEKLNYSRDDIFLPTKFTVSKL